MISENDILSTYSWLTKDLFKRIARKDYPDANNINVEDFSPRAALGLGENYASIMIRVIVHYIIDGTNVEKSFVIKAGHIKPQLKQMTIALKLFEREILMFRDIIPKVEQLLADIGDNTKLAAKCYEVNDDPDDPYLIFEDLTCRNYKNVNRRIGLNVADYKKALSKIARWHAATIVLLEETNFKDYPRILDYQPIPETKDIIAIMRNCFKACSIIVKTMPGFEHLAENFANCSSNILAKTKKLLRDETSFMGLVHGDLWMNNIMFIHNSIGEPVDALLCDFQAPYRGPVIMDVINTLFTSSVETIQDRDWDILVQHYHNERTDILRKLGYTKRIPSLTETQIEFLEKGVIYASMGLSASSSRMYENTGEDFTDFIREGDDVILGYVKTMSNPKCRKIFEFSLDYFSRKGYFDV